MFPGLIYLSNKKELTDMTDNFGLFLRRRIKGGLIKSVKQISSDRILCFEIVSKGEFFNLYVELFSKGNLILTDSENNILSSYRKRIGKTKFVKEEKYQSPEGINIYALSKEEFIDFFKDKEIIDYIKAGFGKTLSYELFSKGESIDNIYEMWLSLLKQQKETTQGYLFFDDKTDEITDFAPIDYNSFSNYSKKAYNSFSMVLDEFTERFQEKLNTQKISYQKSLKDQEKVLDGIYDEIDLNTKKAEFFYENYEAIKNLLAKLNNLFETENKAGVFKFLKSNNIKFSDFNEKEKSVILTFGNENNSK
jgi:predicted ribosome quality control (RQC) complex YloA/Tae2 family protein